MAPSAMRVAACALALLTLVFHRQTLAQLDTDRLYAELTRYPELAKEVWPGDFNNDGITDLVAGRWRNTQIVTVLGRGDGTFDVARVAVSGMREPVGTGDVDGDGAVDILALRDTGFERSSWVIPGRGNGSFAEALRLAVPLRAPTFVTDMNGDGQPDLVTAGETDVRFHPGTGGFTFGAPTVLAVPGGAAQNPIVADVNGDALADVVAVSAAPSALHVFLYTSGNSFQRFSITLAEPGLAVAAGDLNGDGVTDLVVSMGVGTSIPPIPVYSSGSIRVLLGRGGLTFDDLGTHLTENGPVSVAIADFDGDGVGDVATGNVSPRRICQDDADNWDTVSLFRGLGAGVLGARASIALGNSMDFRTTMGQIGLELYQNQHHRLHVAQIDGDGRPDLVTSPGGVLLSRPARPNSPPVADAGPDRIQRDPTDEASVLEGSAIDPDNDLLTFEWTDETGRLAGSAPWSCITNYIGTHTFTLTVTDGRGGVSADSMMVTFADGDPTLPLGWNGGDVGDTGAPGFTLHTDRTTAAGVAPFEVTGAGADIWGTSDAFQFASMIRDGDFDVSTLVTIVQDVHEWTKAGLMIRESLSPDSRHASVFVTPAHGVVFQRRPATGALTVHTQGPATRAPVWLRLTRAGEMVTAFTRASEQEPWAEIGTQALPGLGPRAYVGLAVTSHLRGRLATAYFTRVSFSQGDPALPAGWLDADVGMTSREGSAHFTPGQVIVQGSGADIWRSQDAFHFTYVPVAGDVLALVPVLDLEGPHAWSKVGLMIRQSLDPASPHHFLLMSEANGLAYQRRLSTGDLTHHTAIGDSNGAAWFRIVRSGSLVTLAFSRDPNDPASWQVVGQEPFPPGEAFIGLAVTSHLDGQLATATFGEPIVSPGGGTAPFVGVSASPGPFLRDTDIPVFAFATDVDHGIAQVVFEVEEGGMWMAFGADSEPDAPALTIYKSSFRHPVAGPVRIRARAIDRAGVEAISPPLTIQIVDTPPPVWTFQDIGAVGRPGSHSFNPFDNSFILTASGADIWGASDAFRFAYTSLPGNGSIVARLETLSGPHPWTKVGIMMRQSTSPASPHAFMLMSRDHGLAFQRRTVAGGLTTHTAGPGIAQWLRLTRIGSLIIGSTSHDGVNWTDVDSDVLPTGAGPMLVGVALTSHDNGQIAIASLRSVTVTVE